MNEIWEVAYNDNYDETKMPNLVGLKFVDYIDYSDGVIEAGDEVNAQLLEYAKSKQLPILGYPGKEDYGDAYTEFYNKIIGE